MVLMVEVNVTGSPAVKEMGVPFPGPGSVSKKYSARETVCAQHHTPVHTMKIVSQLFMCSVQCTLLEVTEIVSEPPGGIVVGEVIVNAVISAIEGSPVSVNRLPNPP